MDLRPELDLKVLYYFTVLAEEKHFGIAAKRIGIGQPPLSLQIKKLEEKVGGKLFDRSNKRIKLTQSGEALLPEALKFLASSKQVLESIRRINKGEAGVLSIGFTSSTIICGLPAIIQKHKQLYPKVEILLKERSPAAQLEELANGTLDIGFIREPVKVAGIDTIPVFKEDFIAVLSSSHSLAKKTKLNLKDLEKEPFVLFPQNIAPMLYNKVREIFSQANFYPHVVQEAFEWQTIVNLVEADLGVSICPSSFQKMKIGQIKYIPLADVKTKTTVSACLNINNQSQLIKPFLALAAENNA